MTSVERAIREVKDINIAEQPDDEVKKLLRTLVSTVRKGYQKVLHLDLTTVDSDSDEDPVDMLNQFLRDSFYQGFKSQNSEKFFATFKKIEGIGPNTASNAVGVQGHQPNEIIVHPSPQGLPGGVIEMPEDNNSNLIQPNEIIVHPSPREFPGGVIEMPEDNSNRIQPNEIIVHPSPREFPGGVIEMPEDNNSNNDKASATPVRGVTTSV